MVHEMGMGFSQLIISEIIVVKTKDFVFYL